MQRSNNIPHICSEWHFLINSDDVTTVVIYDTKFHGLSSADWQYYTSYSQA